MATLREKNLNGVEIDKITNGLLSLGYTAEDGLEEALGVYTAAGFADCLEEELHWTPARATTTVAAIQQIRPPAEPERRLSPRIDEYSTFRSVQVCFALTAAAR